MLGGVALPLCKGQGCAAGDVSAGPSLGTLVLYSPNERWSVGVAAQAARVHCRQSYLGQIPGGPFQVDADLTSGFVGAAARYVPLPQLRVTPILQLAIGTGFQMQTGDNYHCNDGLIPTGHLGVGGQARASKTFSFFALASATVGLKTVCGISDGPGATPFAGWGLGLHAGAAFDVAL